MHRILVLADLHIGNIKDVDYVYEVIKDIFDEEIHVKKTDAVVIDGDWWDRLLKLNEEYTIVGIKLMSHLVRLCLRSKTKIRIVYGTESHEMGQYKIFSHYFTEPGLDMKVVERVSEEELLPGINVLYLPEEYIESKEEYYKDYLYSGKHYDYIFGHGIIEEGMTMLKYDTGVKSNEKKVPRFKAGELSAVSDFYIFGHYHTYTEMDGGCYLGSLFRSSFGEEEPKGYGILESGPKFTFVENKRAYVYKTYVFDQDSTVYGTSDELIQEIKKIRQDHEDIFEGHVHGKIRMVFNTPPDVDVSFKDNLRTTLFNDKYISPLIKESSEVLKDDSDADEDDEYAWVLDNSLPHEDKIHRFMDKNYDSVMSLEELSKYINEDLSVR